MSFTNKNAITISNPYKAKTDQRVKRFAKVWITISYPWIKQMHPRFKFWVENSRSDNSSHCR